MNKYIIGKYEFTKRLERAFHKNNMSATAVDLDIIYLTDKTGMWEFHVRDVLEAGAKVTIFHKTDPNALFCGCKLGTTKPCAADDIVKYVKKYVHRYSKYGTLSKKEEEMFRRIRELQKENKNSPI